MWNDDEIAPNTGFPAHPHANMEIITYVREGAITHQDSLGNKGRTEAGDVQVMSAGSGIRHSEYNLEPTKTRIFQIWIEPTTQGGQPTWGAKPFPKSDRSGKLVTIASGFEADKDALPIRADARVLATTLKAGESAEYAPDKARHLYLVPAAGAVEVNGVRVNARDGAAIRNEASSRSPHWKIPNWCWSTRRNATRTSNRHARASTRHPSPRQLVPTAMDHRA